MPLDWETHINELTELAEGTDSPIQKMMVELDDVADVATVEKHLKTCQGTGQENMHLDCSRRVARPAWTHLKGTPMDPPVPSSILT